MTFKSCFFTAALATAFLGPTSLQAIELMEIPAPTVGEPFVHEITLDDRGLILNLKDNRALFSRLDRSVASGVHEGGNRFFQGSLEQLEDSWARLSWVNGHWSGTIFDGTELFVLDRAPTRHAQERSDQPNVALYRSGELDFGGIDFAHPSEVDEDEIEQLRRSDPAPATRSHDDGWRLPVTIVSDTYFTANHGDNALAVAAGRVNTVDGVLTAEVGTGLSLMHHEVLTSNDILLADTCSDLRQQFRDFFVDGNGSDIPFAGVAHLFTGRKLSGAVGCATSRFFGPCTRGSSLAVVMDMPEEWQSIGVFAHELGHNLGAPHDAEPGSACEHEMPGKIMAPDGGTSLTYSDCSVEIMQTRLDGASCLVRSWLFRDRFRTHE